MVEGISIRNKAKLLLSADGDVGLYEVNDDILRDFDTLLSEFKPPRYYDKSDFVEFIKRKRGSEAIRFIKSVGCYPVIEPDYKNVFWFNF